MGPTVREMARRVASRKLAEDDGLVEHHYVIRMSPSMADKFRSLLHLLHYSSAWGHSGLFGVRCDGDGGEVFRLPNIDKDEEMRAAVDAMTGVGSDVEIAVGKARFEGRELDDDAWVWGADAKGHRRIDV